MNRSVRESDARTDRREPARIDSAPRRPQPMRGARRLSAPPRRHSPRLYFATRMHPVGDHGPSRGHGPAQTRPEATRTICWDRGESGGEETSIRGGVNRHPISPPRWHRPNPEGCH